MSRKKIKKSYKTNIKLITVTAIVIIFIICIIYNIIALFINPTDTFLIENGEISLSEDKVGYIIREEKVFQGKNYKNGIYQIKNEGQRVAKGDPIFRYYTTNEETLINKISQLDLKIQDALDQNQKNIYSSDISVIDSEIEEKLKLISKTNKQENILEYKKEISSALTKKAKLAGELSSKGSYIKELIDKRSKYEEQLNSGTEYMEATISGVVSYRVDGLEEILNVNNIDKITEETLTKLELRTGQIVPASTECAKIVNNYTCYIATTVDSDEGKEAKINDTVYLSLSTGDEVKANIYNILEQDGKKIIIFNIKECVEKLISYRKISFEIIWWRAKGLKVPNTSILEKDGLNYIVRKRVGYSDDILVKVLKTAENYSIIENYTGNELREKGYSTEEIRSMKSITLYDEVLLKPIK